MKLTIYQKCSRTDDGDFYRFWDKEPYTVECDSYKLEKDFFFYNNLSIYRGAIPFLRRKIGYIQNVERIEENNPTTRTSGERSEG